MRSFLRTLIPLVVVAHGAATARAQQPTAEAEAQQTLAESVKLLDGAKLREAAEKLRRVIQLVPHAPNPHRLLGIVQFRLGSCADAVKEFDEFLSRIAPNDRRITEVISMRDRCREELAPKVGKLLVDSTPRGATVRLDDERAAPIGKTPVELSAVAVGPHVVFVELDGFRSASRGFNLAKNETLRLEFGLQRDADALVSAKTVSRGKSRAWVWGLVAGVVVAGAAVGVGVGFGTYRDAPVQSSSLGTVEVKF